MSTLKYPVMPFNSRAHLRSRVTGYRAVKTNRPTLIGLVEILDV